MPCPSCGVVYATTAVRRTKAGLMVDCPICGPQRWRALLTGHPSHPDYQPPVISERRATTKAGKAKRTRQKQRAAGAQLHRETVATR